MTPLYILPAGLDSPIKSEGEARMLYAASGYALIPGMKDNSRLPPTIDTGLLADTENIPGRLSGLSYTVFDPNLYLHHIGLDAEGLIGASRVIAGLPRLIKFDDKDSW